MKKLLLLLVFVSMMSAGLVAATPISSCQTISSAGTYELTTDVAASGTCFRITAGGVTLDCQGNTIRFGLGLGGGDGVRITANGATIQNCNIRGAPGIFTEAAIDGLFSSGATITDNNITSQGQAIFLDGSTSNIITNNRMVSRQTGIFLFENADSNIISNNSIFVTKGGSAIGMGSEGGASNNISSNTLCVQGASADQALEIDEPGNRIFNNIIFSTASEDATGFLLNFWNTSLASGTNIVGGSLIGGNAYLGAGSFSRTCADTSPADGICDSPFFLPFSFNSNNVDYLPLAVPSPPDADNDSRHDFCDNCPISNADQKDQDTDGLGDACDSAPCDQNANLISGTCVCVSGFADSNNALVDGCEDNDTDLDTVGDSLDNCVNTPNTGQEDNNSDGSGDACQPTINITDITSGAAGGNVTVTYDLKDPNDDNLSGNITITAQGTTSVILSDGQEEPSCSTNYFPEGITGEGIGYSTLGGSLLGDLADFYQASCLDGIQDYELALGTCASPGSFSNRINIPGAPQAVCLRKVDTPSITFDLLVTSLGSTITFDAPGPLITRFFTTYSNGIPGFEDISAANMTAGQSHTLQIFTTDGTTAAVDDQERFTYQGEDFMVFIALVTDSDNDGVDDEADNCPDDFNPDQSDLDIQDGGDVCDICPDDATDTCDTSFSAGASIGSSGGIVNNSAGEVTIDIPSGALSIDTSLSMTKGGSNFQVAVPGRGGGTVLYEYTLGPPGATFDEPVALTFIYDTGAGTPSVFKDEGAGFFDLGFDCTTTPGVCTGTVTSFSTFALIIPTDTDGDGVPDDFDNVSDLCNNTSLPEILLRELSPNRFADIDGDGIFETIKGDDDDDDGPGTPVDSQFTLADTDGCSCLQILEFKPRDDDEDDDEEDDDDDDDGVLGEQKFGCTKGTMKTFIKRKGWAKDITGSAVLETGASSWLGVISVLSIIALVIVSLSAFKLLRR